MDNNDTRLLRTQLPQKGVKKMIAVASRFDNALNDVINDCDSIAQTISCTKSKLGSRALEIFSKQKESFPAEVYKACTEPIFVSSMFENISHKNDNDLNEAERFYFNTLNEFNDLTPAVVKEIGNFEPIREKFGNVVETKDETLSAKAKNFVPTSKAEAKNVLKALSQIAEKNLNILKTQDVEQIQNQKKAIANQINSTKGSIEEIFGNMDALLERAKMETLKELRDASRECAKLSERTGTETHIDSYTVSDTRLLHPFTWGKKHTVYTNYTTSYSYVDASDALENIRAFSSEACSDIEETFYKTVDIAATKRKLLNVIVENFDASDELYDPAFFRLVTEQTLNGIEFPVVKIDTSEKTKSVSSRFSGEIKGGDIYALRALMGTTIEEMLDEITDQFAKEVSGFKGKISELKTTFSDKLLETITGNLDNIIEQFNNKEREIHNYTDLLEILKKQPQLFA